jgi:hypothetical protein
MLSVAIPLAGKSQWGDNEELKHCLRSLEKNLKLSFHVKLFAKYLPKWLNTQTVQYEIIPRWYPDSARKFHKVDKGGAKHYENYFDVLHKIDLMSQDESLSDPFLYMYDDILLLRPVENIEDIDKKVAMMHYKDGKHVYENPVTKWSFTALRAFDLLKRAERPIWDYETHLPRILRKNLLRSMFESFPPDKESIPYAPSTLYYNLFYDKPDEVIYKNQENKIKAGFYGTRDESLFDWSDFPSTTMEKVDQAVKGKLWLNYNHKPILMRTSVLTKWIAGKFPNKSKFEK